MSFLAKLVLDSNEYNIVAADYEVSQPVGRRNMPIDIPHLGLIHITIESSNRSEIFAWAMSAHSTKDGSIVFYRRDAESSMKTVNFTGAFCIKYREVFEADGATPMKIELTLAPRVLESLGVEREELWPGHEGRTSTESRSSGSGESQESESEITSFIPS